jgi:hypothetical protein
MDPLAVIGARWPACIVSGPGRPRQLCPGTSDLDFLRDLDRIVNFDAKISNGAFDLRAAQQQLNRTQVTGSPVDQRRFGSAQGVRAELQQVEADARDPLADETGGIDQARFQPAGAIAGTQDTERRSQRDACGGVTP